MRQRAQVGACGSITIAGGRVEAIGNTYDCDGIGSNEESIRLAGLRILGGTVLSTGGYAESPHSITADALTLGADRMVSCSHEPGDRADHGHRDHPVRPPRRALSAYRFVRVAACPTTSACTRDRASPSPGRSSRALSSA